MRQFDVILTNPPFQDTLRRGKTPHKLWIDFTQKIFEAYLADDGLLCQVSPSSFRSPNSKVLALMKDNQTVRLRFDTSAHFPDIGSTFADYVIRKSPNAHSPTEMFDAGTVAEVTLDDTLLYLPAITSAEALRIHQKVVFTSDPKLAVEWDYVTCHNVLIHRSDTLSRTETPEHVHPVFHTNRQTWWSTLRQDWADEPKVMWTRSGYTQPFYDPGVLGGTDMAYFVRVSSESEGRNLAHNMNLALMRYIYATARWSGFGNERVFASLPRLASDVRLSDDDLFAQFGLTAGEVNHVRETLG